MSLTILKTPSMLSDAIRLGVPSEAPISVGTSSAIEQLEDRIRAELKQEAEKEMAQWKQDAFEQGYRQGMEQGYQEGVAAGKEAYAAKSDLLQSVIDSTEKTSGQWMQSVQQTAAEIAHESLAQLFTRQAMNPSFLAALLQEVLGHLHSADVLAIRLHPTEKQLLENSASSELGMPARWMKLLQDDHTLEQGGVVIDTPRGEYRATIEVALQRLKQQLTDYRKALTVTPSPHQGESDACAA